MRLVQTVAGQQAFDGVVVRLDPAVGQDVRDVDAAPHQLARDENRPVAVERLLLGAHQRQPVAARAVRHAVQAAAEQGRAGQARVPHAPLLVTPRIVRPCAQLAAEEHVPDPLRFECARQRLAVELRVEAAVGRGADVGERGDAAGPQQGHECLRRVVGVADRVDGHL